MQRIERDRSGNGGNGDGDGDGIEWERTSRLCLYRSCIFAPGYVVWLGVLERTLGSSSVPWVVAKKVFLDQALWTPPCMVVLYGWMGLAEHVQGHARDATSARNLAMVYDEFKCGLARGYERAVDCLWPTLRVNWPVVSFAVCFSFYLRSHTNGAHCPSLLRSLFTVGRRGVCYVWFCAAAFARRVCIRCTGRLERVPQWSERAQSATITHPFSAATRQDALTNGIVKIESLICSSSISSM